MPGADFSCPDLYGETKRRRTSQEIRGVGLLFCYYQLGWSSTGDGQLFFQQLLLE
jgi:hypothetical protein